MYTVELLKDAIKRADAQLAKRSIDTLFFTYLLSKKDFLEKEKNELLQQAKKAFGEDSDIVKRLNVFPKHINPNINANPPTNEWLTYTLVQYLASEAALREGRGLAQMSECDCNMVSRALKAQDSPRRAADRYGLKHLTANFPLSALKNRTLNLLFLGECNFLYAANFICQANRLGFGVNVVAVDICYDINHSAFPACKDSIVEFKHVLTQCAKIFGVNNLLNTQDPNSPIATKTDQQKDPTRTATGNQLLYSSLSQYAVDFEKLSTLEQEQQRLHAVFAIDFRPPHNGITNAKPDLDLLYTFRSLNDLPKSTFRNGLSPLVFLTAIEDTAGKETVRVSAFTINAAAKEVSELDHITFDIRRNTEMDFEVTTYFQQVVPCNKDFSKKLANGIAPQSKAFDCSKFCGSTPSNSVETKSKAETEKQYTVQDLIRMKDEKALLERLELLRLYYRTAKIDYMGEQNKLILLLDAKASGFDKNSNVYKALAAFPKSPDPNEVVDPLDDCYKLIQLWSQQAARQRGDNKPEIMECDCGEVSRGIGQKDSPRKALDRLTLKWLAQYKNWNLLSIGEWKFGFLANLCILANQKGIGVNAIPIDFHYNEDAFCNPRDEFNHVICCSADLFKVNNYMDMNDPKNPRTPGLYNNLQNYGIAFQKLSPEVQEKQKPHAIFMVDFHSNPGDEDPFLKYAFTTLSELPAQIFTNGESPLIFFTSMTPHPNIPKMSITRVSVLKILAKEKRIQELEAISFTSRSRFEDKSTGKVLQTVPAKEVVSTADFSQTLKTAAQFFDFAKFAEPSLKSLEVKSNAETAQQVGTAQPYAPQFKGLAVANPATVPQAAVSKAGLIEQVHGLLTGILANPKYAAKHKEDTLWALENEFDPPHIKLRLCLKFKTEAETIWFKKKLSSVADFYKFEPIKDKDGDYLSLEFHSLDKLQAKLKEVLKEKAILNQNKAKLSA